MLARPLAVLSQSSLSRCDSLLAAGLAMALACVFFLLHQANLAYDGAVMLVLASRETLVTYPSHLLLTHTLAALLTLGRGLGIAPEAIGFAQSAFTMGIAIALFFLLLRRYGISRPLALGFTLLLASSAPVLENATTVELYGITFLCVLLALHAWRSESLAPTPRGAVGLILACTLMVCYHAGTCHYVLSLYLALAWSRRASSRFVIQTLVQGFCVLLLFASGCLAVRLIQPPIGADLANFFGEFWTQTPSLRTGLLRIIMTPIFVLAPLGGMLLIAAPVGLPRAWRAEPALHAHVIFASVFYFFTFTFWPIDRATFYLPLLPIWGVLGAFALQNVASVSSARLRVLFCILAGIQAGWVLLFNRIAPEAIQPYHLLIILAAGGLFELWIRLGKRFEQVADTSAPRQVFSRAIMAITLGVNLLSFGPYVRQQMRPDHWHGYLDTFTQLATADDPQATRLITTMIPSERITATHGFGAMYYKDAFELPPQWQLYDGNPVARWIRQQGHPNAETKLWIDSAALDALRNIWEQSQLADIPLSTLHFDPHVQGEHTFYRISFVDPQVGRIHAAYHDAYPPEDPATTQGRFWTKAIYEFLPPTAAPLNLQLALPVQSGRTYPTRVTLRAGSTLVDDRLITEPTTWTLRMSLPPLEPGQTLMLETSPTLATADGRKLGVEMLGE